MIGDIVIANVLASACLVLLIYVLDMNEKEPPWTLICIYLLSMLVTFFFGKIKGILFTHYKWEFSFITESFIVAGFFEELIKFLVVMVFVWPLKSFNEETDGIIYYLVVAAGFAVLENVGYSYQFVISPYIYGLKTGEMSIYRDALQQIVLFRAVSGHIFINVISGFFLGLAKRRRRWWLLIIGFVLSVLLHGCWNLMAVLGKLSLFALIFAVADVILFYRVIRMSFYFKFFRRLKSRMDELIKEARQLGMDENVMVLMQGIKGNMVSLRQMEGRILKEQAKEIITQLPVRMDSVPRDGESGVIERLLKVNSILGRNRIKVGWTFWTWLFIKFAVAGFFVLMILMTMM